MKKIALNLLIISSLYNFKTAVAQEKPGPAFGTELLREFPALRDLTVSGDETEAYFTAQSPSGKVSVIMSLRKEKGAWTQAKVADFSGQFSDLEPFLSPDGLRLYFVSNRPMPGTEGSVKDMDIWYVARDNRQSEWAAPVNLGRPVNSEHDEFYPAVTLSGNLYFTSNMASSKGKDDIFVCRREGEGFAAPVSVSDSVNTESYEFNAFVASDESFLLFSGYNRPDGSGSGDLYISRRGADGIWSAAENLGSKINSAQMDYCPFVNLKTGTLYFTSRRFSPAGKAVFRTSWDLLEEVNKYENGASRLYKVSFSGFLKRK